MCRLGQSWRSLWQAFWLRPAPFMLGMAESIDLFERIIVMLATGALGGSIALTIITMRKLGKRD